MAHPLVSYSRAKAISSSLFLLGLAIISYTNAWWPFITIVIGVPLSLRQYLLGRRYEAVLSLFIFIGTYVVANFNISWDILLPIIFVIGAIYTIFREFFGRSRPTESEYEESINKDIERM